MDSEKISKLMHLAKSIQETQIVREEDNLIFLKLTNHASVSEVRSVGDRLLRTPFPRFIKSEDAGSKATSAKKLVKIMNQNQNFSKGQALILFLNFLEIVMPDLINNAASLGVILYNMGYLFTDVELVDTWTKEVESLKTVDLANLSNLDSFKVQEIAAIFGILMSLIGKPLLETDYSRWISKCKESFASFCDSTVWDCIIPSEKFCCAIQDALNFNLRNVIFHRLRETYCKERSVWRCSAEIVFQMLRRCELGAFLLAHKYVILQNPILLYWKHISREVCVLSLACRKFADFGDIANFCRLLYPEDKLKEFDRKELQVLATIAKYIVKESGDATLQNCEEMNPNLRKLCTTAVHIVQAHNGATTEEREELKACLMEGDHKKLKQMLHQLENMECMDYETEIGFDNITIV